MSPPWREKTNWIWQLHLTFISDSYIWHLYLTFISDISIWHLYLTFIFDLYIWHFYLTFLSDIYIRHLYLTFIFGIYIWHFYLTFMSGMWFHTFSTTVFKQSCKMYWIHISLLFSKKPWNMYWSEFIEDLCEQFSTSHVFRIQFQKTAARTPATHGTGGFRRRQ